MLDEHDHNRIDARKMLGRSSEDRTATIRRERFRSNDRNSRRSDGACAIRARLSAAAKIGASSADQIAP